MMPECFQADHRLAILLITGSRALPRRRIPEVELVINDFVQRHRELIHVILHGDCPDDPKTVGKTRSVDRVAKEIGNNLGLHVLDRPADWNLGKKGGPVRNRAMVAEARAMLDNHGSLVEVHAFPHGVSPGTRNCIAAAKAVHLHVFIHEDPS